MKNIVLMFTLVFSTSVFFASIAKAEMDTFAQTTASKLNVRGEPHGKSIIEQLQRGSVVAILDLNGIWANILYLENDDPAKPKKGWVSAQYLRILYTKTVDDSTSEKTAGI